MRLVIDGYNLFHVAMQKGDIQDKQSFIVQIAQYKNIKKHDIVLVFDGGSSVYEMEEYRHGMLVIYSGYAQTADQVILHLIQREQNRAQTVIITSDREIRKEAERAMIPSIKSELFYEILLDRIFKKQSVNQPKRQSITQKMTSNQNPLIDELMMQHSPQRPKDEDLVHEEDRFSRKKIGKEEKTMLQLIKKL